MLRRHLLGALCACAATLVHAADTPAPAAAAPTPPPPYGVAITLADARRCVAAVEDYARGKQWFMVVTVVDSGGHVVASERMDNAQYGSVEPALHKAQTAAAFRRPSKAFEDVLAQGGAALRLLKLDGALPIEGGLPIIVKGALVGAVGVSGGTSAQDGEAAAACVKALGG
ncbi:MAG: heme-binding protein [Gammaproteobacteria bacterium]|nr:heme-binding protein [Gammaproteobacteria bacterium]